MGQVLYKKKYSIREFYTILVDGLRTLPYLQKSKKNGNLSEDFIKRIMLAVTEVNGCEVCSYEHTKSALEMGMSGEEIKNILTGTVDDIPVEQLKAILFSQHYAETKGAPTKDTWNEIVEVYGEETALGILGAIRMIMVGNSYGIALSAFKSRLKGTKIEQSSLSYELTMLLSLLPLLPTAIIHALITKIVKKPMITFPKSKLLAEN